MELNLTAQLCCSRGLSSCPATGPPPKADPEQGPPVTLAGLWGALARLKEGQWQSGFTDPAPSPVSY